MSETPKNESYEFNTDLTFDPIFLSSISPMVNIQNVKTWLKDPMLYNREIRKTSRLLYNSNGIYTNAIDYMVSLPTLDRVIHGKNKNHERFKENKNKFNNTLEKIKDKEKARDILHKGATEGIAFYYYETQQPKSIGKYLSDLDIQGTEFNSDVNASIIPLPTDYCKIVGEKNSSYQVAFDCTYFDQFRAGDARFKRLRRYPKEISKAYRYYKKDPNKKWVVLDNDKTITLKTRAKREERWGRPLGLAAFVDMLYQEYYTETKRNILDEVNNTVVYQTFPEGEKKGQSSLTQDQQEKQHNNIKSALMSKGSTKGIKFFSIASGSKLDRLNTNIDFLKVNGEEELINKIATGLGFAGSLLNGNSGNFSSQKSNIELISAEVFSWLEQIQSEFNKVINKNTIQDPEVFVEMSYLPTTHVNRKEIVGFMKDLYTNGKGSLQAWIAATGFSPTAYLALMDEEIEEGFDEKYVPHATSYTMSGKEDNQKPLNNESDNPNTVKNKQTGANPVE